MTSEEMFRQQAIFERINYFFLGSIKSIKTCTAQTCTVKCYRVSLEEELVDDDDDDDDDDHDKEACQDSELKSAVRSAKTGQYL